MTLKDLLAPDLYAQVETRLNEVNANEPDKTKHVRFADLSEGKYVSVDRFNTRVNNLSQQVTDLQEQIGQRDTDMADLQTRLTAAQADASQLTSVQETLSALQQTYQTEKQSWETKTAAQAYEFAVKTAAEKLHFSSAAAKRDFVRGAIDKQMQMEGDSILGFTDYVNSYKDADPGAFVADSKEPKDDAGDEKTPPQLVLPKTQKPDANSSAFNFHFSGVRPNPATAEKT